MLQFFSLEYVLQDLQRLTKSIVKISTIHLHSQKLKISYGRKKKRLLRQLQRHLRQIGT